MQEDIRLIREKSVVLHKILAEIISFSEVMLFLSISCIQKKTLPHLFLANNEHLFTIHHGKMPLIAISDKTVKKWIKLRECLLKKPGGCLGRIF